MKLKSALLAVFAAGAAIAAPAFADNGWHRGHHWYPRYYAPAPVYYRPAPRVVYVPVYPVAVAPGFSFRFNLSR